MTIYKTLHIGEFHTNYCEDFLVDSQIGTNEKLIAVLDGCTMGTESVFASMLFGKILRHIAKKKYYEEYVSDTSLPLKDKLKDVVRLLINDTKHIKNYLDLEVNALLSTLIIGIIDTKKRQAECLTVGDGLICVDGKLFEYDQDDKLDYLGYHLSDNFNYWYDHHDQKLSIANFKDLSFSTDGIFTFRNLKDSSKQKSEQDIINRLLIDTKNLEFENALDRAITILKTQWHHTVTDDLAIIRVKI